MYSRRGVIAGGAAGLAILTACSGPANPANLRATASPHAENPAQAGSSLGSSPSPRARAAVPTVPQPPIVWRPISFPPIRRQEMADYAFRHYGIRTFRLMRPQVIVEHVTVSTTFAPVFAEFSRDVPDYELHELPGLCAHFVIDRDGTIYQLVRLKTMCRHTVGLNWTSFGIEHVGTSDRQILDNPAQMSASLSLSFWLVNSSRIRTAGSRRIARASASRCFCPPDSFTPDSPTRSS